MIHNANVFSTMMITQGYEIKKILLNVIIDFHNQEGREKKCLLHF